MPFKSEKQRKWMHANEPDMAKKWEKKEGIADPDKPASEGEFMDEAKERNYKEEYKKYGSSKKAKKYRAELNKYNRQKGTYGNGDKKDASHKGGKIAGFEEQSKNRGRREKSRLKKEQKLIDLIKRIIEEDFAGAYPKAQRAKFDKMRQKQSEVLGYKLTGHSDIRAEIDDATVKESMEEAYKLVNELVVRNKLKKEGGPGSGPSGNGDDEDNPFDREPSDDELADIEKQFEGKLTEKLNKRQAQELLNQLGGNRFKAMTGAKDFGIGNDGLHFKIGRNSKSISHIVIDYDRGKDLYNMKFLRVRAGKIKVVKKVKGVYADQLGQIFKRYTGMNVRL